MEKHTCLLFVFLLLCRVNGVAQSLEVAGEHDLPEVIISDYRSRLQGENVVNVEKLKLAENVLLHGTSLPEKLSFVPGVSNLSTGPGIGKPAIRGLSGNRIAVFSQGIRMENQQWGDEHGLGLDENGYGNVEIIKGPASLLYGGDALGGVLYFVDEPYAEGNSVEAKVGADYHTNSNGLRNSGNIKLSKGRLHWNLFGSHTAHGDYRDGRKEAVGNSRFHTGDFKTSFGYAGEQFSGSLKYNFLEEVYGLAETEEGGRQAPGGRKPAAPFQDLATHLVRSENTYFFGNSKLKVDAGYQLNNRKEIEESGTALDMNLSTLSYNAKWYLPAVGKRWTVIAGSQGMLQANRNRGEEELIPDASTTEAGLYFTSDYAYSGKSYWQAGLRADGRKIGASGFSRSFAAFNFSTGVFQQLAPNGSLRMNLSSGYRAPNLYELLSDGVHEGTNRYETGNRELKVENSYQADLSLNYNSTHLELFASPYFNYIRNFIYLRPSGDKIDGRPAYYYAQTNASLYGGEAGFHFHPHPLDWLHLSGSYSGAWGNDAQENALPLMPSQKVNAMVSTSFTGKKALKKFSAYLQNQYSFSQNRIAPNETATPAYNLANAGLAFEWAINKQSLLFNVAVSNLFNATYYDHLSRYKAEGIYNSGRNIRFSISIPLRYGI